jgi:diguanylate cyclase (GGDEF)-like protein
MDNDIGAKLKALYVSYSQNLPGKITAIENQWQALQTNWNEDALHDFHREIHSLCGSAAIYGYEKVSLAARELEVYLRTMDEDKMPLTPEAEKEITTAIPKLRAAIAEPSGQAPAIPVAEPVVKEAPTASKLIYVFENDSEFFKALLKNLAQFGYYFEQLNHVEQLSSASENMDAAALIVEIDKMNKSDISQLVKARKNLQFTMPLICVSDSGDLTSRLKAIRAGGSAYLNTPIDMIQLSKLLGRAYDTGITESFRILIIDDSASLAEYYSLILQQAGMITHVMTNPMSLMETLASFQADLILMDIYMPECSGLELAGVLRQEPLYTGLPIIFLSTEDDKFKQLAAMSVGGDDFLTKPILPQHLVAAIRGRAKRAGILTSYMTRDSLTQLLNHDTIVQNLESELARALTQKMPLTFVLIDIDNFKSINDTYGHLIGDYVLRKLSELLLTYLAKTNFVGRYGGEEFAIVMPNIDALNAKRTCDELREKFAQLNFKSAGHEFYVTFSAGIATFPALAGVENIIAAADTALYQAKDAGRNQIIIHDEN